MKALTIALFAACALALSACGTLSLTPLSDRIAEDIASADAPQSDRIGRLATAAAIGIWRLETARSVEMSQDDREALVSDMEVLGDRLLDADPNAYFAALDIARAEQAWREPMFANALATARRWIVLDFRPENLPGYWRSGSVGKAVVQSLSLIVRDYEAGELTYDEAAALIAEQYEASLEALR